MLALAVGLLGFVLWLLIGHPQPGPTPQGKPDEGPVGEIANMSGFRSGQTALTVRFFPNELKALTTEHGVGYRTWDLEKRKLLPSSGIAKLFTVFSPDGRIVASGTTSPIDFSDPNTGKLVGTLKHNHLHSAERGRAFGRILHCLSRYLQSAIQAWRQFYKSSRQWGHTRPSTGHHGVSMEPFAPTGRLIEG